MQNGAFSSLILFMKGANEMNYPTNAVINSVPAAGELRKVAGFRQLLMAYGLLHESVKETKYYQ